MLVFIHNNAMYKQVNKCFSFIIEALENLAFFKIYHKATSMFVIIQLSAILPKMLNMFHRKQQNFPHFLK